MIRTILIFGVSLLLSICAVSISIGAMSKKSPTPIAMALWPKNGFVAAANANILLQTAVLDNANQMPSKLDSQIEADAIAAFEYEPTSQTALRNIALSRSVDDFISALAIMKKAGDFSKRDSITNLWLAQNAASGEDLGEILGYYDRTLRTSNGSADVILPVLIRALENETFIEPFSELLIKQEPAWAPLFWGKVAWVEGAIVNASRVRENVLLAQVEMPPKIDTDLVTNLVAYGKFERAYELYLALSKKKDKYPSEYVNNAKFENTSDFPPFDWLVSSDGRYGAEINTITKKLEISMSGGSGGLVASQLVRLPPGRYILRVTQSPDDDDMAKPPIVLKVFCASDETSASVTNSIRLDRKNFEQKILIAQQVCKFFWLQIYARSLDDTKNYDVTIDQVSIINDPQSK